MSGDTQLDGFLIPHEAEHSGPLEPTQIVRVLKFIDHGHRFIAVDCNDWFPVERRPEHEYHAYIQRKGFSLKTKPHCVAPAGLEFTMPLVS